MYRMQSFTYETHPIIRILSLPPIKEEDIEHYSSESNDVFLLFQSLQFKYFSSEDLHQIYNEIEKGTPLFKIDEKFEFGFPFFSETIRSIIDFKNDLNLYFLFHSVISWIIHAEKIKKSKGVSILLTKMAQIINKKKKYKQLAIDSFFYCFTFANVSFSDFRFSKKIYESLNLFFTLEGVINSQHIAVLLDFLSKRIKNNVDNLDSLYNFISTVIEKNYNAFSLDNYKFMSEIISAKISQLDDAALKFFVRTHSLFGSLVKDDPLLELFPTFLVNFLVSNDSINMNMLYYKDHIIKKQAVIVKYASTVHNFSFSYIDNPTFVHGLNLNQNFEKPQPLRNFFPHDLLNKIDMISELYIPAFSESFSKILSDFSKNQNLLFLYLSVFLAICEDQKDISEDFLLLIFNSSLFNDIYEYHPFLSSIKYTAVSILINSKINVLFEPIINSKIYLPNVLSDIFIYCSNFYKNEYFVSHSFILLFHNVSLFYQAANVNCSKNINEIETLREILLIFMDDFVNKWSSSSFFNIMFLSYLFEPALQPYVYAHLQSLLLLDNYDNSPVLSVFQTCHVIMSEIDFNNQNDILKFANLSKMLHKLLQIINSVIYMGKQFVCLHEPLISILYILKKDDIDFIMDIIEYFAISSDKVAVDFQTSKMLSDTINRIGVTNEIRLKLIRLLAGNFAPSIISHFLIQQPLILPLFITLFSGNLLLENFELINQLISYSFENAQKCHEGFLDLVLLEFIESNLSENNSIEIERAVSLFLRISLVSSSSLIVHKYISILSKGIEISFYLTSLLQLISNRLRTPSTFLPLSPFTPSIEINDMQSEQYSNGFTAIYWVYLDLSSLKLHSQLFTISDEFNHVITFDFIDSSIVIIIRYSKQLITCTFNATFPQGQWFLLSCSFVKSNNCYKIFASVNSFFTTPEEIPYFNFQGNMKIYVNETLNPKSALIGPFAFYKPLPNDEIIKIQQNGPRATNLSNFKLIDIIFEKVNNSFDAKIHYSCFPTSKLLLSFKNTEKNELSLTNKYIQSYSFDEVLVHIFKIHVIIPLFKFYITNSEQIVTLLSSLLSLGIDSQRIFLENNGFLSTSYLLSKYDGKYLTYSLYSKFEKMNDQIIIPELKNDLIKQIILSFEIWSHSTSKETQMRIVKHWIHNFSNKRMFQSEIFKASNIICSLKELPFYDNDTIKTSILRLIIQEDFISLINTNDFLCFIIWYTEIILSKQIYKLSSKNLDENFITFLLQFFLDNISYFNKTKLFSNLLYIFKMKSAIFLLLNIFHKLYEKNLLTPPLSMSFVIKQIINNIPLDFYEDEINLKMLIDISRSMHEYMPIIFYGVSINPKFNLIIDLVKPDIQFLQLFQFEYLLSDSFWYNDQNHHYLLTLGYDIQSCFFMPIYSAVKINNNHFTEFIFNFIVNSNLTTKSKSINLNDRQQSSNIEKYDFLNSFGNASANTHEKSNSNPTIIYSSWTYIFLLLDIICNALKCKNTNEIFLIYLKNLYLKDKTELEMLEFINLCQIFIFFQKIYKKNLSLYNLYYNSPYFSSNVVDPKTPKINSNNVLSIKQINLEDVINKIRENGRKLKSYKFSLRFDKNENWLDKDFAIQVYEEIKNMKKFNKFSRILNFFINHHDITSAELVNFNIHSSINEFITETQIQIHIIFEKIRPVLCQEISRVENILDNTEIVSYAKNQLKSYYFNLQKDRNERYKNWLNLWSNLTADSAPWNSRKKNELTHWKRDFSTSFCFCPMKIKNDHHYKRYMSYKDFQKQTKTKFLMEQKVKLNVKNQVNNLDHNFTYSYIFFDDDQNLFSIKKSYSLLNLQNSSNLNQFEKKHRNSYSKNEMNLLLHQLNQTNSKSFIKPTKHYYINQHIKSSLNDSNQNQNLTLKYGFAQPIGLFSFLSNPNPTNDSSHKNAYSININPPELSINSEIITIAKKIQCIFSIYKNKIVIQSPKKIYEIHFYEIKFIFYRRILHKQTGIEIYIQFKPSILLNFPKLKNSQTVIQNLLSISLNFANIDLTSKIISDNSIPNLTDLWVNSLLSNFEYLMFLNLLAGRSFNDPSMYPVFPWIVTDFDSDQLEIDNKHIYRNLSLPVGALNPERFNELNERRKEMISIDSPFIFLYGAGYSSPLTIFNWLIRLEPYTSQHIEMQNGHFDHPQRLFYSIKDAFKCATVNSNDYRELIPEFFFFPLFLNNINNFDLNLHDSLSQLNMCSDTKETIINNGDVQLPKWAKSSLDFVYKHRKLLESNYVSKHLNKWIDLIFGVEQNNKQINQFHPFMYEDVWIRNEKEWKINKKDIKDFLKNCGQIPKKLFQEKHPRKLFVKNKITDYETNLLSNQITSSFSTSIDFINSIYRKRTLIKDTIKLEHHLDFTIKYIGLIGIRDDSLVFLILKSDGFLLKYIVKANDFNIEEINLTLDPNQHYTIFCNYIATSTEYGNIKMIKLKELMSLKKKNYEIHGHFGKINSLVSDNLLLVSGGIDASTNIYLKVPRKDLNHTSKENNKIKLAFSIPSFRAEIVSCSLNSTFSSVASVSDDSFLYVISTSDGSITHTISLNGRKPISVEITKTWGFIVLFEYEIINNQKCYYLDLYSINGEKISERKIDFYIVTLTCFSSFDGFDFIILADNHNKIYVFEAYYLQIGEPIFRSPVNIFKLFYWNDFKTIVSICQNGTTFLIPLDSKK